MFYSSKPVSQPVSQAASHQAAAARSAADAISERIGFTCSNKRHGRHPAQRTQFSARSPAHAAQRTLNGCVQIRAWCSVVRDVCLFV